MNIIVKPMKKDLSTYINRNIEYFLLPLEDYSVESMNSFSLEEIKKIRDNYPNIHLFISINKNIMNDEIKGLKENLVELEKYHIEGIFFYDASILNLKNKLNLSYDLVWDQSHMVTNEKTCDYYYHLGVRYALLSKEITKEEILIIKKNSLIEPIVEILSYPSVAFSKRKLVTNYYKDLGKKKEKEISILEKVSNENYYLYEEDNGTNIMKQKLTHGTTILEELLKEGINYILLREDLIEHDFFLEIIDHFSYFIRNSSQMTKEEKKAWVEEQNKLLGEDSGFLFKETIYKVK